MNSESRQPLHRVSNLAKWGAGYFDINRHGDLVVKSKSPRGPGEEPLASLLAKVEERGLKPPVLMRFPHILRDRLDILYQAFYAAIEMKRYRGRYIPVYPIKVNQQRAVLETLVKHGDKNFGLEAGSKPELMAVLGTPSPAGSIVICNGYKDRDFIRLALSGEKLGRRVYLVVEKTSELNLILEEAASMDVQPRIGVRVRLKSVGKGKWASTGGETSKFGLSPTQLLEVIDSLKSKHMLDSLQLIHFHLGSQIANLGDVEAGLREAASYFVQLRKQGVSIGIVDVGGGLGVDYDGTQSRSYSSTNYTVHDYALKVVDVFTDICNQNGLNHPDIFTESGRALTAHHAVLVLNVIDHEYAPGGDVEHEMLKSGQGEHDVLRRLQQIYHDAAVRPLTETFQNARREFSEAKNLFMSGELSLQEWARTEQVYYAICRTIYPRLDARSRTQQELLAKLNEKLADKLFCNFSLFRSLPDSWGVEQVFPILPLSGLCEESQSRAILHDLTCDSDGSVSHYVDQLDVDTTLPISPDFPVKNGCLGIFMTGAYQEILGNRHNLFGSTPVAVIELNDNGAFSVTDIDTGESVSDVLHHLDFDPGSIVRSFRDSIDAAALTDEQKESMYQILQNTMHGNTYFNL